MKNQYKLNPNTFLKIQGNSRYPCNTPSKLISPNSTEFSIKVCCPSCKSNFKILKSDLLKNVFTDRRNPAEVTQIHLTLNTLVSTVYNNESIQKSKQNQGAYSMSSQLNRLQNILEKQRKSSYPPSQIKNSDYKFKPVSISTSNIKPRFSSSTTKYPQNSFLNKSPRRFFPKIDEVITSPLIIDDQKQQDFSISTKSNISYNEPLKKKLNQKLDKSFFGNNLSQDRIILQNQIKYFKKNSFTSDLPSSRYQHSFSLQSNVFNLSINKIPRSSQNIPQKQKIKSSTNLSPELIEEILSEYAKNRQNQLLIKDLLSYCKQISTQIQLPSYLKMLTPQIENTSIPVLTNLSIFLNKQNQAF